MSLSRGDLIRRALVGTVALSLRPGTQPLEALVGQAEEPVLEANEVSITPMTVQLSASYWPLVGEDRAKFLELMERQTGIRALA